MGQIKNSVVQAPQSVLDCIITISVKWPLVQELEMIPSLPV